MSVRAGDNVEISAEKLLWTAPELLNTSEMFQGTKAGDVYSFGIIIQEVITHAEPFCMTGLEPEEIVQRLTDGDVTLKPEIQQGRS